MIAALYAPEVGKIGCVLLQAGFGCDTFIAQRFDTKDWFIYPVDGMKRFAMTIEQWIALAAMPRQERIDRWQALKEKQ